MLRSLGCVARAGLLLREAVARRCTSARGSPSGPVVLRPRSRAARRVSLARRRRAAPRARAGRAAGAEAARCAARRSGARARRAGAPTTTSKTPGARSAHRHAARIAVGRALRLPRRRRVAVERGGERGLVLVRPTRGDRVGREPRRHERLVHPVAGERIDEAGCVADEEDAIACSRCPRRAHREPVAANVGELRRVDAVHACQPVEVRAQPRPLLHPPADAEVRVVALRKDPAVAAGHDAELDPGRALVLALRGERSTARFPRARRRARSRRRAPCDSRRRRSRRPRRRAYDGAHAARRRRAP